MGNALPSRKGWGAVAKAAGRTSRRVRTGPTSFETFAHMMNLISELNIRRLAESLNVGQKLARFFETA